MAQERIKKTRSSTKQTDEAAPQEVKGKDAAALKAQLDDLLDEIDEVLEENAEEFVRSYIQKGGE